MNLRKCEIFAFAEKCQNIAFSKSKGFWDFTWSVECADQFWFSRADKENWLLKFWSGVRMLAGGFLEVEIWAKFAAFAEIRAALAFAENLE